VADAPSTGSAVVDAALLITAIATAIGSIGSVLGTLVVIRRTSPREREDAARNAAEQAAEQILNPQPPIAEKAAVIAQLPPAGKSRRRRRGGRRP
jgi:hypothetical protein